MHKLIGLKLTWMSFLKKNLKTKKKPTTTNNKNSIDYSSIEELSEKLGSTSLLFIHLST